MQQIVECVPNFSNGRDPQIYNRIADTIRAVRGVTLLDLSADADHNRTVITFVGPPDAVEEAAFQAIKMASSLINLDEHEGEHPRIGATDVCPFIPVKGLTTADCVAIARRLGQRVGEDLAIPVYLYGDAATRPERMSLSAIRKGEYELWKEEVAVNPDRRPDFGPAEPKPSGATVIGARPFLIAYNLFLNTDDVAVAEHIARSIRFTSGGLRFVQAKGFLVEGQAQVSMNLTNFAKTPIHQVQEMVRREAAAYGLSITRAELIGMIPQDALVDAAKWYLQLGTMHNSQILEYRLHEEESANLVPDSFLEATAAATAAPGGGSVAALAGAIAAALTQMVAGLTLGREKYAAVSDQAAKIKEQAASRRHALTAAISEDAAAFTAVMEAYRRKELSPDDKALAIEQATIKAAEVPLRVAELGVETAELAATIAEIGNRNAVSDAAAGVLMAQAAVLAAGLNVKINAAGLTNQALANEFRHRVTLLEQRVEEIVAKIKVTAAERGGF